MPLFFNIVAFEYIGFFECEWQNVDALFQEWVSDWHINILTFKGFDLKQVLAVL